MREIRLRICSVHWADGKKKCLCLDLAPYFDAGVCFPVVNTNGVCVCVCVFIIFSLQQRMWEQVEFWTVSDCVCVCVFPKFFFFFFYEKLSEI